MKEKIICEGCGNLAWNFTIDENGCSNCRANKARAKVSKLKRSITWGEIRQQRDILLQRTDYMDNVSWRARKSDKELSKFDDYRNALRDVTDKFSDPSKVVWPKL